MLCCVLKFLFDCCIDNKNSLLPQALMTCSPTPFESEAYWNERYLDPKQRKSETFDWYLIRFDHIVSILDPLLKSIVDIGPPVALVDVGCGNSPFLLDAVTYLQRISGNTRIRAIGTDFSHVVVEQQSAKIDASLDNVEYLHADARTTIGASSGTVGLVMDKATLDAVDCSGNSDDSEAVVATCVNSLVAGGYFISLTCRPPQRRFGTILKGIERSGIPCEQPRIVSLNNDPVAPSHVIIVMRLQ